VSPKSAQSRGRRGTAWCQIRPLQTSHLVCMPPRLPGVQLSVEVSFALPIDFWVLSSLSWHPSILNIFLTILQGSEVPTLHFCVCVALCLCVCGTRVWTQGLYLESLRQPIFVMGFFQDRVSQIICPGWLWTASLLISASWVARIKAWATRPAVLISKWTSNLVCGTCI
jgi:hypothetical protein